MSLTIKGATSGSVDVVAPASGSDVTLTLPTTTATVETTASSIASSRLTGALPALNGSALTGVGVDGIVSTANATAITIDANENVGLGVTPESWYSSFVTLQIGNAGAISGRSNSNHMTVSANIATNTAGTDEYINTDYASHYQQYDGKHVFKVAPSGTADAAISWNTAVTINATGRVGIGESTPLAKLHIKEGDSGATSISSNFDQLVLEDDLHSGMVILSGTNSDGAIYFGDSGSSSAGQIKYKHSDNSLQFSTADVDSLKIDSAGRVTMPNQPAFNVHVGSALGITANTWHQFVFSAERFDIGSNFSSNVFTAPITGKYQLSFHTRINNLREAAGYYQVRIASSNKSYVVTVDPGCFDSDSNYWSFSLSALADMDSNDTAYCSVYQNGGASSAIEAHETVFSGYLVA
jgi:hypothetical protein